MPPSEGQSDRSPSMAGGDRNTAAVSRCSVGGANSSAEAVDGRKEAPRAMQAATRTGHDLPGHLLAARRWPPRAAPPVAELQALNADARGIKTLPIPRDWSRRIGRDSARARHSRGPRRQRVAQRGDSVAEAAIGPLESVQSLISGPAGASVRPLSDRCSWGREQERMGVADVVGRRP